MQRFVSWDAGAANSRAGSEAANSSGVWHGDLRQPRAFQLPQHALIKERGGLSGRTLLPQADFGRAQFPRPYLPGEEQALAQPAVTDQQHGDGEERQQDR